MSSTIDFAYQTISEKNAKVWFNIGMKENFPSNEGVCIKYKNLQIAVFNFNQRKEWYACQNLCPHKMEMVLSRGIIGDEKGIPKVACPLHKNTFSLETGENLNGNLCAISLYPVKVEGDFVFIGFDQ